MMYMNKKVASLCKKKYCTLFLNRYVLLLLLYGEKYAVMLIKECCERRLGCILLFKVSFVDWG